MSFSRIAKRLPPALRNDFWVSLVDAVGEEIELMKSEASEKKEIYSFYNSNFDSLIELNAIINNVGIDYFEFLKDSIKDLYAYTDEEIEQVFRDELLKIPFFILNKANLTFYKSAFNFYLNTFDNKISIYKTTAEIDRYTQNTIILRDLVQPLFENLLNTFSKYSFSDDDGIILEDDFSILGYNDFHGITFNQEVTWNFTGQTTSFPTLDEGAILDSDIPLFLDMTSEESKVPTKHLSLEFVANRLIQKFHTNTSSSVPIWTDFIMTKEFLNYIYSIVSIYKKSVEVPHIGIQMTVFLDRTGYWDLHSIDGQYTIPNLHLKGVSNPQVLNEVISSNDQILYIKFGTGTKDLPSYSNSITFPTDLDNPIAIKNINTAEKISETNEYAFGGIAEYIGQERSEQIVDSIVFDGSTTSFSDNTFLSLHNISPVYPKTVKFIIENTTNPSEFYQVQDDGFGNLISEICSGSIDYNSGVFSFDTSFEKIVEEEKNYSAGIQIIESTAHDILENSIYFSFSYENGVYYIKDKGDGTLDSNFSLLNLSTSSVVYTSSPAITLNFTETIELTNVNFVWKYQKITFLDNDYVFKIHDVYTKNDTLITEAGLYVYTDASPTVEQMVAYITFAPIELVLNRFHLNLAILVEK